jgi:hypothetical protein
VISKFFIGTLKVFAVDFMFNAGLNVLGKSGPQEPKEVRFSHNHEFIESACSLSSLESPCNDLRETFRVLLMVLKGFIETMANRP